MTCLQFITTCMGKRSVVIEGSSSGSQSSDKIQQLEGCNTDTFRLEISVKSYQDE